MKVFQTAKIFPGALLFTLLEHILGAPRSASAIALLICKRLFFKTFSRIFQDPQGIGKYQRTTKFGRKMPNLLAVPTEKFEVKINVGYSKSTATLLHTKKDDEATSGLHGDRHIFIKPGRKMNKPAQNIMKLRINLQIVLVESGVYQTVYRTGDIAIQVAQ